MDYFVPTVIRVKMNSGALNDSLSWNIIMPIKAKDYNVYQNRYSHGVSLVHRQYTA